MMAAIKETIDAYRSIVNSTMGQHRPIRRVRAKLSKVGRVKSTVLGLKEESTVQAASGVLI